MAYQTAKVSNAAWLVDKGRFVALLEKSKIQRGEPTGLHTKNTMYRGILQFKLINEKKLNMTNNTPG